MIDYYKTYMRFIETKGIPGPKMIRRFANKKGLQGHHILPKSLDGGRGENIVWLSPVDHCVAHWLLTAAMTQKGEDPIYYFPANARGIDAAAENLAMRWNPLSKVKIRFEAGAYEKVVTVTEAVNTFDALRKDLRLVRGIRPKLRKRIRRHGPNSLPLLFEILSRPQKKRKFGDIWISIAA
jgi:hypothetical protein